MAEAWQPRAWNTPIFTSLREGHSGNTGYSGSTADSVQRVQIMGALPSEAFVRKCLEDFLYTVNSRRKSDKGRACGEAALM